MLLVVTCPVCGARGGGLCPSCASELRPAPQLPPPPGVDACVALFAYEGVGRDLIAGLKYRNTRSALPGLGRALASLIPAGVSADVVTWAPTTPRRRRRRGFDQAELLARALARTLGRPCASLLERAPGPAQTGRSSMERHRGPVLAARRRAPPSIVVVDDVVTTGATATAAARALRTGGAQFVVVAAAARTPLRWRAGPHGA